MKSTPTTGGCNPLYVSEGLLHPCAGAEEYGCEVAWACTTVRLDGTCKGSDYCDSCAKRKWTSEPDMEFMGDGGWR